MTDLQLLCLRMADELDHYRQLLSDDRREVHCLAVEARAAVAAAADGPAVPAGREPAAVAGEPSDEELLTLDQLRTSWNVQADAANSWDELGADEIVFWAQKQALNRWGRTAAPPAAPEGKKPSESDVADLFYRHMGEGSEVGFENAIAEALARWGCLAAPPAPTTKELKELEGLLQEMLGSPSAAAAAQWETNIKYLSKFLRMADSAFLRQQLLQQENHRFREPERTILCDILANGTLLPDPDGTRYGIPPAPLEGEVGEP